MKARKSWLVFVAVYLVALMVLSAEAAEKKILNMDSAACSLEEAESMSPSAYLGDHTMGLYPPPGNCYRPVSYTYFRSIDQVMSWAYVYNMTTGQTVQRIWHTPEGTSFAGSVLTVEHDSNWCWWSWWPSGPPNIEGWWSVDFLVDGNVWHTDSFYVYACTYLNVVIDPVGGGKVVGSGIDCGEDCSEAFWNDEEISLTAYPNPGWKFLHWDDGSLCYTANLLTLAMDQSRYLTAKFAPDNKIPVLIVPGIMGSMSSFLFDPEGGQYEWNPGGPIDVMLNSNWVLDPIDCIGHNPAYKNLISAFRKDGYILNKNLFLVAYDWRKDNGVTAKEDFARWARIAKKRSGSDKIDVVAHSMGGLIARYYIERLNRLDIRKLVMLGTPNGGSAKAYYPWEGGTFSVYSYWERKFFLIPMVEDMKVGYGLEDLPDYEFIQKMFPSVCQLLPISPYLVDNGTGKYTPINRMNWKNNLLPKLSYSKLVSNLSLDDLVIFAGTDTRTLKDIRVTKSVSLPQWTDGRPVKKTVQDGDGTVLRASAALGEIRVVEAEDVEHGILPDKCRNNVVNFIAGREVEYSHMSSENAKSIRQKTISEDVLFVGSRSKVLVLMSSPSGSKIGCRADYSARFSDLDRHYYRGSKNKTAALGVYDPLPGEYSLHVTTKEDCVSYELFISRSKNGVKQSVKLFGSVCHGDEKIHIITINGDLEVR